MKAMILAAGRGERMRPLTDACPKPLLMAGGRPLIVHLIERLALAGLRELVINTAWQAGRLHAALGDGSALGVNIAWSDENPALETAGGIRHALPMLGEVFVVVNGDIWTDYDFSCLREPAGEAHLVLVDNPPQHPQGDFALEQGRVREDGAERLTFSGIGIYRRSLFAGLDDTPAPLAPLLREAMARDAVSGEHFTGHWFDVGTPQRLADLDRWLSERG